MSRLVTIVDYAKVAEAAYKDMGKDLSKATPVEQQEALRAATSTARSIGCDGANVERLTPAEQFYANAWIRHAATEGGVVSGLLQQSGDFIPAIVSPSELPAGDPRTSVKQPAAVGAVTARVGETEAQKAVRLKAEQTERDRVAKVAADEKAAADKAAAEKAAAEKAAQEKKNR